MSIKTTKKAKATRAARGTGRLYKRTKSGKEIRSDSKTAGTFWLQYTLNGKRKRHALTGKDGKPITDLREAEAERKRLTAPLRAGKREDQLEALTAALSQAKANTEEAMEEAAALIPLSMAWEAYLDSADRPDSGEDTLRFYAAYWTAFTTWMKENAPAVKDMRNVTPQIAAEYAKSLNGGTSANTYNKHTGFLRLFFRVLEQDAGLKENPFDKVRRKTLTTQSRRELTIAELRDILTKATGDLQILLSLGTFTGLRLGDCCTLKWGEVDLDRGLIKRIPNKTAKKGKPVLIGIPAALFEVLAMTPRTERKGYVLPRHAELYTYRNDSGTPTRRSDITSAIQTHFTNCGIQIHKEGTGFRLVPCKHSITGYKKEHTGKRAVVEVGFHSLRHTYVSLHAERGTPQALIQGNVGHSNPAMTAHYLHVNEETAVKTAQVLSIEEPKPASRQVPDWIREKIEAMTAKNWKSVRSEILEGKA
ncbi:MAG: site-specific integrase [Pontiellaceae bacterium]|nr:site-specific integrase [Pontiellaceae bacterium]MBN2785367.1 site-specific integrase [Pontiellaceae bacterium]